MTTLAKRNYMTAWAAYVLACDESDLEAQHAAYLRLIEAERQLTEAEQMQAA